MYIQLFLLIQYCIKISYFPLKQFKHHQPLVRVSKLDGIVLVEFSFLHCKGTEKMTLALPLYESIASVDLLITHLPSWILKMELRHM